MPVESREDVIEPVHHAEKSPFDGVHLSVGSEALDQSPAEVKLKVVRTRVGGHVTQCAVDHSFHFVAAIEFRRSYRFCSIFLRL